MKFPCIIHRFTLNTDMAMTTSGVFGASNYPDPIRGNFPPSPTVPREPSKADVLRENIEKFIKGEITAAQLEVIKKTLS